MSVMKTSAEWVTEKGVTILDPDGWDRKNYQYSFYEELITEAEFDERTRASTTLLKRPEPTSDLPASRTEEEDEQLSDITREGDAMVVHFTGKKDEK